MSSSKQSSIKTISNPYRQQDNDDGAKTLQRNETLHQEVILKQTNNLLTKLPFQKSPYLKV